MKSIFFILFLLTLGSFACSKKTVDKTTTTKIETPPVVVQKDTTPKVVTQTKGTTDVKVPDGVDAHLIAKIKRTPCYGKCPVFTIELYDNGMVKYNGLAYAKRNGSYTAQADGDFIKNIQSKALAVKYLSFESKYPIAPITIADLPITTTYIRIGNDGKLINDNFDAPRELIEFENWLELEFEKLDWQLE